MDGSARQKPLAGLQVVELASVLAGPAVGMFLAELGASVLKIENQTTGGDVTRTWKLPKEDPLWEYSAYYCSVNWGKEICQKDLTRREDLEQVRKEIAGADILISNFKREFAIRMGLDYLTLSKDLPRLIYAELSGFGEADHRPAFDVVLQAEAGFLYMTGEAGGKPVKMPVALIDLLAAHQLKEGILLALLEREKTGKGSWVKSSLLESAVASLANQATNWLMAGHIPGRMGSLHPNIAPYGEQFACADGKLIVLAIGSDRQFEALCRVLNLLHVPEDERFAHNSSRVRNRLFLQELLGQAIAGFFRPQLLEALSAAGVPVGSVRNMQEVFEQDLARDMILDWRLSDGSPARSVRSVAFTLE